MNHHRDTESQGRQKGFSACLGFAVKDPLGAEFCKAEVEIKG
jgi:hypothetical protein